MRVMIGIAHPKQVHFWKNIIRKLTDNGHEVKIVAWEKDITLYLLETYGFDYELVGKNYEGLLKKAFGLVESDLKALKVAEKFKPDIFVAGSPALAHVSRLLKKPYIYIIDTEHASLAYWLTNPFSDVICTPSCFKRRINSSKHVTFNGYLELAYLHPNYFKPDPSVLDDLNTNEDGFIVLRLISWSAIHDTHSVGFNQESLGDVIKSLEDFGEIYITSERKLTGNLENYRLTIEPEKLHSLLYYASLYLGEGGTTAVEAALLGTPAIHIEAFKSNSGKILDATYLHGNFFELAKKYEVLYTFANPYRAIEKAKQLLNEKNVKKDLKRRVNDIIKEKTDVVAFITKLIESYL